MFWISTLSSLWCTLVQLLHYILKCIHLEWRWLFGPFTYMLVQTVWFILKIISIPYEEWFSGTTVGCTATYFVKIIWWSRWFCNTPFFEAVYCFICGRRRVAVARYRMICLVLLHSNRRKCQYLYPVLHQSFASLIRQSKIKIDNATLNPVLSHVMSHKWHFVCY